MNREFIIHKTKFSTYHASTIVQLSDGNIMVAWFGGTSEGNPDVSIWGAIKANGEWKKPNLLVNENDIALWNPVLFYSLDRRLWLYFKIGVNPSNWTAGRLFSMDSGNTWSDVEYLPAGILGPVRAKPYVMEEGTIVSGTSHETFRSWSVWIERSIDHAITWTKIGPIVPPTQLNPRKPRSMASREIPGSDEWENTSGIIQPSVISIGKNLRLYARSTSDIGKICIADSEDGGINWTKARIINVPNPNSGIDVLQLKDGRIILIYNHTFYGRTPLNLAVSQDGEIFKNFATLEDGRGEFSYPNIIQAEDGDLHISYTYNRKNICYIIFKLSDIPTPDLQ